MIAMRITSVLMLGRVSHYATQLAALDLQRRMILQPYTFRSVKVTACTVAHRICAVTLPLGMLYVISAILDGGLREAQLRRKGRLQGLELAQRRAGPAPDPPPPTRCAGYERRQAGERS